MMVRKQVYIRADQEERLKAAAAVAGVTEAEIIRRGIELALGEGTESREELRLAVEERVLQYKALARSFRESAAPYSADAQAEAAWQSVLKMMARTSGRDPLAPADRSARPTSPKWDREEAYAERMARLLR